MSLSFPILAVIGGISLLGILVAGPYFVSPTPPPPTPQCQSGYHFDPTVNPNFPCIPNTTPPPVNLTCPSGYHYVALPSPPHPSCQPNTPPPPPSCDSGFTYDPITKKCVKDPVPPGGQVRIAAVGDWGMTSNTLKTSAGIRQFNPQVVVGLGDYAYLTTESNVKNWWDNYVGPQVNSKFEGARGNHENDDLSTYRGLFNANGGVNIPNNNYNYVVKQGNVAFVFINTEDPSGVRGLTPGASDLAVGASQINNFVKPQLDALQADNSIDWIIPVMHKPMYTGCWFRPSDVNNAALHPLFDLYPKVELVLSGHMHGYSRTPPVVWNNGQTAVSNAGHGYFIPKLGNGQVYVTAGMGGKDYYNFAESGCAMNSFLPVKYSGEPQLYGFLGLDVQGKTLTGKFYENNGAIKDEFTITR